MAGQSREVNAAMLANIGRKQFRCHYCGRTFGSPQALGGHHNGHSRQRDVIRRLRMEIQSTSVMRNRAPTVRPRPGVAPPAIMNPSHARRHNDALNDPMTYRWYQYLCDPLRHPMPSAPLCGLWMKPHYGEREEQPLQNRYVQPRNIRGHGERWKRMYWQRTPYAREVALPYPRRVLQQPTRAFAGPSISSSMHNPSAQMNAPYLQMNSMQYHEAPETPLHALHTHQSFESHVAPPTPVVTRNLLKGAPILQMNPLKIHDIDLSSAGRAPATALHALPAPQSFKSPIARPTPVLTLNLLEGAPELRMNSFKNHDIYPSAAGRTPATPLYALPAPSSFESPVAPPTPVVTLNLPEGAPNLQMDTMKNHDIYPTAAGSAPATPLYALPAPPSFESSVAPPTPVVTLNLLEGVPDLQMNPMENHDIYATAALTAPATPLPALPAPPSFESPVAPPTRAVTLNLLDGACRCG